MQEQPKKRGHKANADPILTKEIQEMASVPEETKKKPEIGTFTLEQVQKMIEEAIQKHDSEAKKEAPAQAKEYVVLRFQDEVNDDNEILLGPNGKYGTITGKSATITVEKRDFVGDFRTKLMQDLLRSRNLIVVDGLTDEERKIYGVDYQQGEYLEPAVYERLIDMGDGIVEIYEKLNPTWRAMIAIKFIEAFENKTLKCSRETLLQLNKISKRDYANLPQEDERRKGGFYSIIHRMNAADETDEE